MRDDMPKPRLKSLDEFDTPLMRWRGNNRRGYARWGYVAGCVASTTLGAAIAVVTHVLGVW